MFYLFRFHHWTPDMYTRLSAGGQDLVWGMAIQECELREEG